MPLMAARKVPAGCEFAFHSLIIERVDTAVVLERDLAAWAVVYGPVAVGALHFEPRRNEPVAADFNRVLV